MDTQYPLYPYLLTLTLKLVQLYVFKRILFLILKIIWNNIITFDIESTKVLPFFPPKIYNLNINRYFGKCTYNLLRKKWRDRCRC